LTCVAAGGTAAISIAATTASLAIAADTYVRGELTYSGSTAATPAIVVNAGTNLYMDMTHANGALYRISDIGAYRKFSADCSAQHIAGIANRGCSIQGYGGTTAIEGTSSGMLAFNTLKNVYLKNVGDANTVNNTYGIFDVENNVFDSCGMTWQTPNTSSDNAIVSGNYWKNTPLKYPGEWRPANLHLLYITAITGGTRQIANNVFDGRIGNSAANAGSGTSSTRDFTITGNYFGAAFEDTAHPWVSFSGNFVRFVIPEKTNGDDPYSLNIPGDASSTYWLLDTDVVVNPHYISDNYTTATTYSSSIFESTAVYVGDSGEWINIPANGGAVVQNSVFTCNPAGFGGSELTSATINRAITALHNIWCGSYGTFGFVDTNETALSTAGSVTIKSNIMWAPTSGTFLKLATQDTTTNQTQDVCTTSSATVSNCDYNAGYQSAATKLCPSAVPGNCTNQGRGYAGKWSYTPGAHDVDGTNPGFVDVTRKIADFDIKYLGKPLATAYAAGNTYARGDIASNSDANIYGGESFNFRCIDPSGCTGDEAPGLAYAQNASCGATSCAMNVSALRLPSSGPDLYQCFTASGGVTITSSSTSGGPPLTSVTLNYANTSGVTCRVFSTWRNHWEFASLYWLREAVAAGTTYTDGAFGCVGCNPVQALVGWVKAGYVVQNPKFWSAGHDGKDIGAVHVPLAVHMGHRAVAP
jgi:hypothetical protein